jgi:hypothetical protein
MLTQVVPICSDISVIKVFPFGFFSLPKCFRFFFFFGFSWGRENLFKVHHLGQQQQQENDEAPMPWMPLLFYKERYKKNYQY